VTKAKPSYATTNLKTPICTAMLACDGDNLNVLSRERGYCGKCKDAMDKRAKKGSTKPLRGETTGLSASEKREHVARGEFSY
jgi:hypothetical protein